MDCLYDRNRNAFGQHLSFIVIPFARKIYFQHLFIGSAVGRPDYDFQAIFPRANDVTESGRNYFQIEAECSLTCRNIKEWIVVREKLATLLRVNYVAEVAQLFHLWGNGGYVSRAYM